MSTFLIQVSGRSVEEHASELYRDVGGTGPRYCDDPLHNRIYINTGPSWRREGYGRREAWENVQVGDDVLIYCTGSVEEYPACLSHLLEVDSKEINEDEGFALLRFDSPKELDTKIPHSEIADRVESDELSEEMGYCGQEGFNITQVEDDDLDIIRMLSQTESFDTGGRIPEQHLREKYLEELLRQNPEVIASDLTELDSSPYFPEYLIPDLLFEDSKGDILVIELKTGDAGYSAIGQLGSYLGAIEEQTDRNVRGLLVCGGIDERARHGADRIGVEVKTYEITVEIQSI